MKNKIYYSYGKRVLFTSLTAAALSLAAGNLDTVKAASLTASRSALRKSTKTKKKTVRKADKVDKISSAAEAESPAEIKQDQATAQDAGSADSVTVKAHYVNQKGEQIAPDETLTGKLNDPYPDKEIAGYEIVTKPKGQFSADEPEITYVYADSSTQTEKAAGQASQAKIAPRSISNITWSGLKVTFDNSTGLLTIPGGTVNNPSALWISVVANGDKAIKKIKFTGPLKITGNAQYMFGFLKNLTEIEGLEKLDTSAVTNMGWMFGSCSRLTNMDVSGFNTSNVRDMFAMFFDCQSLTSLDVSGFSTDNVENMFSMFKGCKSLTSLDVSNFKMTSATSREDMLKGLSQLNTLILGEKNYLNGVGLNNSGVWVNVGKGTMDQPEGSKKWKSAELMDNYNGQKDRDTYVRLMSVTVHYRNEDGTMVASDKILTGKVGEKYKSQPKKVDGYVLKSIPKDASGTFTNADQEIIYVYTNKVTVTAHYVDQDGRQISQEQITGKIGDPYPDQPLEGYVQVSKPKGNFSDSEKEVTYVYAKQGKVTAHYIDQNTKEAIIPDATLTGKIGDPYPDQPLEGYVQVSKPKGTFSDSEKDVTYVYTKTVSPGTDPTVPGTDPAVKGATVTVHYQDAKGNPLAPDEILSGKVGEGYVSTAKTIAGYELVNRPENATGFFSQNPQSVTYIYAPVESNSGKQPGQNNQTGGGSNNSQGSSQASHGKEKQPHNDHANSNSKQQTGKTAPVQPEHKSPAGKQNKVTKEVAETEGTAQLAQTGSAEKEQGAALTLGSLSLLGGLIGSWFNRRKKKD